MGQLVADAQLAATQSAGAQVALMNSCGVRGGLGQPGPLRYEQLFSTQPFGNELVTLTMSGAELRALMESQWSGTRASQPCGRLQVSRGLQLRVDAAAPAGQRVRELRLQGALLSPDATVRVTVNRFLHGGGDGFTEFAQGRDVVMGPIDIDALEAYLQSLGTVHPPAFDRVLRAP
jgi:5'-nucleotidase